MIWHLNMERFPYLCSVVTPHAVKLSSAFHTWLPDIRGPHKADEGDIRGAPRLQGNGVHTEMLQHVKNGLEPEMLHTTLSILVQGETQVLRGRCQSRRKRHVQTHTEIPHQMYTATQKFESNNFIYIHIYFVIIYHNIFIVKQINAALVSKTNILTSDS